MIEIFNDFIWTKENKTITQDHHHVPGLRNFTHWNFTYSPPPTPMHYHSHIIEFHCMVKGHRSTRIEEDGSLNTYTYHGNQCFVTLPFEIHGCADHFESPCEFYAFQLSLASPDRLLGLNEDYSLSLYHALTSLKKRQFKMGRSHLSYLRSAFNFFSYLSPEATTLGCQFLTTFLFSLPFLAPLEEVNRERMDSGIERAMQYIKTHISQPILLESLARTSGYSLSRFKSKFKEETGITPADYVQFQKIEEAKHLLTTTDRSITELAYSLGYSSGNYFCMVFKKYTNHSPGSYRRLVR